MNWLSALSHCASQNLSCVLITIVEATGSAPRILGTRMVVCEKQSTDPHGGGSLGYESVDTHGGGSLGYESVDTHGGGSLEYEAIDTLGGGALEYEAIDHARKLLQSPVRGPVITHRQFVLGSDLTQCCGRKIKLQFDCQWANDFNLHVFGAGHVAQEVARVLKRLPCRAVFHDPRQEWLDKLSASIEKETSSSETTITTSLLPENVYVSVEACQPNSYFIVMTHSHELDMELIEAILTRADSRYCGLIASKSKAASFRGRLKRKGFTDDELGVLTSPLGEHFKTGNTPMEVAIAAVSDVLHLRNAVATRDHLSIVSSIDSESITDAS